MTVEENKQIAQRAFETFMAGELSALADLATPDIALHQCGFLEPIRGVSAITSLPGGGRLGDREVRLERIIGEGDLVAIHWRTTGRYRDPDSPQLDGTHVNFPSMSFLRLEGGKIAEIWNIQDRSTLQTQLYEARAAAGGS
jgi:ketosteroid isomerase-like protein